MDNLRLHMQNTVLCIIHGLQNTLNLLGIEAYLSDAERDVLLAFMFMENA